MRILFLVPNPLGTIPGQRFRFEQYLPHLWRVGMTYKVCPFVPINFHRILYKKGHIFKKCIFTIIGFLYRICNIFQALKYDLVFIYREATPLGPPIFEKILRFMRKPIIFDFDDAIYLPSSSEANKFVRFFKFPQKTNLIIKMSSLVMVGNRDLEFYALRLNKNTVVMPTVIDTELYRLKNESSRKEKICVGWSGSLTTITHINLLKGVLKKIYLKYAVDIKIIGSKDFFIPGIKVIAQDWRLDTEIEDLCQIDIGLMPLGDDEWSRCKCGLKALQYMALGIPAVCSPYGVNKEIIDNGVNGFLCRTEEEWIKKISFLIEDSQLRRRMGLEGRKRVEERYSVEVAAPKFLELIQKTNQKK